MGVARAGAGAALLEDLRAAFLGARDAGLFDPRAVFFLPFFAALRDPILFMLFFAFFLARFLAMREFSRGTVKVLTEMVQDSSARCRSNTAAATA